MSEFKNLDTAFVGSTSSAGNFAHLSTCAQGVNSSQRQGVAIHATSLKFIGGLFTSSTTQTSEQIRVVFAIDLQANGALPTGTQLLTTLDPVAHYNLSNAERFLIIKDFFWTVNNNLTATDLDCSFEVDLDAVIRYNGAGTFPVTNSIFVFWCGANVGSFFNLRGQARLMFHE